MKFAYRILSIFFIVLSCNSDDDQLIPFCSVDNPVEDLAWLKADIEEREQNINENSKYYYIVQLIYKEESIIIYANCDPLIDSILPIFNCEGENIGYVGDENFSFGFDFLNKGQIIWKTNNFACEF